MKISVALLPELLNQDSGAWAIVIDTLRFTTTATQALHAGANSVSVASEVAELRELANQSKRPLLLCGERHCKPIEGFDLGNSPWEYTETVVAEKELYFTTTNGTRAIAACSNAKPVLLAALANRNAVCQHLQSNNVDQICIVCAGTDKKIALEDTLAAGAIANWLVQKCNAQLTGDEAHIALSTWQSLFRNQDREDTKLVRQAFEYADGGINLIDTGYAHDLDFAAQLDSLNTVPISTDKRVFIPAEAAT